MVDSVGWILYKGKGKMELIVLSYHDSTTQNEITTRIESKPKVTNKTISIDGSILMIRL